MNHLALTDRLVPANCQACGCREPYPSRSSDEPVLVDQPAVNVGSPNVFRFGIRFR